MTRPRRKQWPHSPLPRRPPVFSRGWGILHWLLRDLLQVTGLEYSGMPPGGRCCHTAAGPALRIPAARPLQRVP